MSVRTRCVAGIAAIAFASMISGACGLQEGDPDLSSFMPPPPGVALTESAWSQLAESDEPRARRAHIWLLPSWISGSQNDLSEGGKRIDHRSLRHLNLGLGIVNLPFLPLWFDYDHRILHRDGTDANNDLFWTPVWSDSDVDDWPADERRLATSGLPFLFSTLEFGFEGADPEVVYWHTLWSLGPAGVTAEASEGDERVDGWILWPLMGAGVGALLWTSAELESAPIEASVHGPMYGFLGWISYDQERTSRSMLLSGLLWYSHEHRSRSGQALDSINGPLWGAFGWGRDGGEPELRLFWIPIPLPGGGE